MKKLTLIAFTLSTLISCNKSNITLKHHWIAQEGHDVQTWSHATFCDAGDKGVIDTVELDNTVKVDSTKFYPEVGSIVFHSRIETEVKGIYDRSYCQLKVQID